MNSVYSHKFPCEKLIKWQKREGRNSLPWQRTHDPYQRWLAEIMLQQTQVTAVIPYFLKFLEKFPTIEKLAEASEDEVMAQWAGLGYYSRARNLHSCAKKVVEEYKSSFPLDLQHLLELPGIGRSTAGAIISAVTDKPAPMLDGNVKRVFARFFGINAVYGSPSFEKFLWELTEKNLPASEGRAFSQGLMDLGSMICTRSNPKCMLCPVFNSCLAGQRGCAAEYPVKAKTKTKPEKHKYWYVFMKDGRVWLEKRTGGGVWKHLWSLPESDSLIFEGTPLPQVVHEFTHYKLTAFPVLAAQIDQSETENSGWFSKKDLEAIGIPSPVKKFLLRHVFESVLLSQSI